MNLKKYDKFSMAHGVECRFPFLDWKLAAFCFSLPGQSKISNGFTKRILRDVIPKDRLNMGRPLEETTFPFYMVLSSQDSSYCLNYEGGGLSIRKKAYKSRELDYKFMFKKRLYY
mgnify:CR=1 FL=1